MMIKAIATLIACTAISMAGCGKDPDSGDVAETTCSDPIRCPGTEMVTPHHVTKVAPTEMPAGYARSPEFSDSVDFDNDGDPASRDCDDHDAKRRHGLTEVACDGIDQNCDGRDECDRDVPVAAPPPTTVDNAATERPKRTL